MKNRTEEYWALVGELAQPPQELAGSVERARKRAKRAPLRRLAAPAASLAAAAASFVLLVNVFPTFALACSGVPIIRELTAAVAFSPSLSAAVAHDYVQYIGQSQTVDGVTVKLEYAIVDQVQMIFFYAVDGKNTRFYTSPSLTSPEGEPIGGYGTSTTGYDGQDGLESMSLYFAEGNIPPTDFTLEMFFMPLPEQDQMSEPVAPADSLAGEEPDDSDPREDPGVLRFSFDLSLEPGCEPTTVEVGRWLELDGQRIQVDRLVYSPTRTILYLGEDGENTAWLGSLKFWFEDEKGTVYDNIDGSVSASGEAESESYLTYYFQSFYYDPPKGLTLRIDKAEWLDKDAPHVFLDLATGDCTGLPDGVRIDSITASRDGRTVTVKLLSPMDRSGFAQSFEHTYWDPEGGEHFFNSWGCGTEYDDEGRQLGLYELLYFNDYPWDTVELELSYTGVTVYEEPVSVPLF